MKNVLVDLPISRDKLEHLRSIEGVGEVEFVEYQEEPRALPSEVLRDKHVLICELPPLNLEEMTSLELIQVCSHGYAQLYDKGLVERGIRACNARGTLDVPVAEWNIAMMINLARDLRGMIRNQQERKWDPADRFQMETRGRVAGIWGYGGIGRETARLAKALGLTVHVMTRSGVRPRPSVYQLPGTGDPEGVLPDKVFVGGQETEFLRDLDFLVLAMPLTPQTEGLLGEPELRTLKPSAFLLNSARGPLVQEDALLKALREGWIAGAALDAHYYYPLPPEHPLWAFPNVIVTPHISGQAANPGFAERLRDLVTQNLERYVSGQPLLNELTPAQLNGEE